MQTSSWEQKAPLGPGGGEPSSLAPRSSLARRSLEVLGWRTALLPLPAPHRPARAAPLDAREREAEPKGGGRRRSPGGGREKEQPERRGRRPRRGLEAEAAKEGLLRGFRRGSPGASRQAQTRAPHTPGSRESHAPEKARGGERYRASLSREAQIP